MLVELGPPHDTNQTAGALHLQARNPQTTESGYVGLCCYPGGVDNEMEFVQMKCKAMYNYRSFIQKH